MMINDFRADEYHCMGISEEDLEKCIIKRGDDGSMSLDINKENEFRKICPECIDGNFCQKYHKPLKSYKHYGPARLTECFNDEQE